MSGAPKTKRMRKPRFCDSCHSKEWPAFGIGCPCFRSEKPPELRDVYLWHCGAPACEADCRSRYAARLYKAGRPDLATKLTVERPVRHFPDALPLRQASLFGG